jgi:hypothetical protein
MIRLRRWSVSNGFILLTLLAISSLQGQDAVLADSNPDQKQEDKWIADRSLTLTPRSVATPALKYRLFPVAMDLKEGNAVPIYLRLAHEQNDETRRQWREKPAEWNKLPLDEIPAAEARQLFQRFAYNIRQLELGAQRKTADWNYTLDAGDPIALLLPDAQDMRYCGTLLAVKARVEIAAGDYPAAAHTLETGFAFSRHIAQGPFLINGMVAIAIANQLADALADWVGQPNAPNLYWSITALPRPLIDLRQEFEFEYRMLELQFPDLADLKRERAPAEWDAALKRIRTEFDRLAGLLEAGKESPKTPRLPKTAPTDPAAQSPELPEAKRYLTEQLHLPADKVDAMPPAQVLLLCLEGIKDDFRDDFFKSVYLPTPQAISMAEAALKRMKSTPHKETTRLPLLLLPAIPKVIYRTSQLDRKIAALRTIEALRLYAANHEGQLPDKLADITDVPVPNDPGTGMPFQYQRDKDTATVIAPPLKEASDTKTGQRYRLTVKEKS